MTRPKDIGTAAETAVVRYLRANGFPGAERRALAGSYDLGDIVGIPGLVVEVKGGKAAEAASDAQIAAWMIETEVERINAGADIGLLVRKRKAVGAGNAGQWWAHLSAPAFVDLLSTLPMYNGGSPGFTVTLTLADAVQALRWSGYGDELDEAAS